MKFSIYDKLRGRGHLDMNDGDRIVEDSEYVSNNRKIEAMLLSGALLPKGDEVFDEDEIKEDYEIPIDAKVRDIDMDLDSIGSVMQEFESRQSFNRGSRSQQQSGNGGTVGSDSTPTVVGSESGSPVQSE